MVNIETIILDLIGALRTTDAIDEDTLISMIRVRNKGLESEQHTSKRMLLPYYLEVKKNDPHRWASWDIDAALEKQLLRTLRMKPRRTASGVATITVITKPNRCANDCLYCPNDVRMPKSYLSDEPACQRAERNFFDPYLQVSSRLRVLRLMGHATDKIELIVLGGTFSDYPPAYQIWFISELFRALNEAEDEIVADGSIEERFELYCDAGLSFEEVDLEQFTEATQRAVDARSLTYNQAIDRLYGEDPYWQQISAIQEATLDELSKQHAINETAQHRVVGLVVETRPSEVSIGSLTLLRKLGCTKIQMGVQSIDEEVLALNDRPTDPETVKTAFELLRLFGFKTHTHFMRNLYGSTLERDVQDYLRFVTEEPYRSDEIKLYPCVLVEGTGLKAHFEDGSWQPYSEEELVTLLATDVLNTPAYVRISRMIRDISAHDILAGNKKANLRQAVESEIEARGEPIREIRAREISTDHVALDDRLLDVITYRTTNTKEAFIQWITPLGRILGFLRLSLPLPEYLASLESQRADADIAVRSGEAMIREVHIYGSAAELNADTRGAAELNADARRTTELYADACEATELNTDKRGVAELNAEARASAEGAQHYGLGRQLIDKACDIAQQSGYRSINVISSVGTREYYRGLGFTDRGLYQQKPLVSQIDRTQERCGDFLL
ncbi:MAG: radical SAM protein [Coriobacteriia bacterium]|nr:radical SAM protein [Coriobacteriia bacterium]